MTNLEQKIRAKLKENYLDAGSEGSFRAIDRMDGAIRAVLKLHTPWVGGACLQCGDDWGGEYPALRSGLLPPKCIPIFE